MVSLIAAAVVAATLMGWFGRRRDVRSIVEAEAGEEDGLAALSARIEQHGPLHIRRVRAANEQVMLDLGDVQLSLKCYWPPRTVPSKVVGLSWHNDIGWLVDVDNGGMPFRVYASNVELYATP